MSNYPSLPVSLLIEANAAVVDNSKLSDTEQWWANQQLWLAQQGYVLRPRYRPGWVPSWKRGRVSEFKAEDGLRSRVRFRALIQQLMRLISI